MAGSVGVLLLGIGLVLGARYLLTDSGLFTVETVEVAGAAVVPVEAVRAAAAVPLGVPLVSVDSDAVARRVTAVPGIGSATVSRHWPSTLFVQVTERAAVAITAGTTERRLVAADGTVYAPVPEPPPPLPALEVATPGAHDPATVAALRVLAALPEPVRREVVAVAASSPDAVTVRLSRERTVRWGSVDQSDRKAAVLVPLLTRPGAVYDVASPDLPTVRP